MTTLKQSVKPIKFDPDKIKPPQELLMHMLDDPTYSFTERASALSRWGAVQAFRAAAPMMEFVQDHEKLLAIAIELEQQP